MSKVLEINFENVAVGDRLAIQTLNSQYIFAREDKDWWTMQGGRWETPIVVKNLYYAMGVVWFIRVADGHRWHTSAVVDFAYAPAPVPASSVKRIDAEEFRNLGLLMEVNRRFLHPRGLALEIKVEADGTIHFGGVWDYRDDPEGIAFDDGQWFPDDILRADYVEALYQHKLEARQKMFGTEDGVQPIPPQIRVAVDRESADLLGFLAGDE